MTAGGMALPMGAGVVAVGVSLVILLVITAVLSLRWRNHVRHETPKDRYLREMSSFRRTAYSRSTPRTHRRRRNSAAASLWAAGMTSSGAVLNLWAAGRDGNGGTDSDCSEGDSGGGASCGGGGDC
jgi:uncharacterized membrane protein YgcG